MGGKKTHQAGNERRASVSLVVHVEALVFVLELGIMQSVSLQVNIIPVLTEFTSALGQDRLRQIETDS